MNDLPRQYCSYCVRVTLIPYGGISYLIYLEEFSYLIYRVILVGETHSGTQGNSLTEYNSIPL